MSKSLSEFVAKCSQMSSPKTGTGQGGDRCCEATLAMIDKTYKLGPKAKAGEDAEALMYAFTALWNHGATSSALEPTSRIDDFMSGRGAEWGTQRWNGNFANVQTVVDRGHVAYAFVRDYRHLRLLGGANPFAWNPERESPAGHILLIVGYGDGVIVHDPLRGLDGQPAEYSVTSFEACGWESVGEIVGPRLDQELPAPFEWKIVGGATFWSAADHFYGDTSPDAISFLEKANPHLNPRALPIGGVMLIPPKPGAWPEDEPVAEEEAGQ